MNGVIAGVLGCLFGVVGVFAFGLLFVPLAFVCAIFGLVRGVMGRSAAGVGTSLLAGVLGVVGFVTSPSLLLLTGMGLAASLLPISVPPPALRGSQATVGPASAAERGDLGRSSGRAAGEPAVATPIFPFALPLERARAEAEAAVLSCRGRRLRGELATFVQSAQCANPLIVDAYRRAGYPHMDLVLSLTTKRLEVSEAVDRNWMTEAQANAQLARFATDLVTIERQRDGQR